MKTYSVRTLRTRFGRLILMVHVLWISALPVCSQECDYCIYYQVTHLSRVEGHPYLGEWEQVQDKCIPLDSGRDFKVTADGTEASKFEVSQVVHTPCVYGNLDPIVEFIDTNGVAIPNPSAEEYGSFEVIAMNATSVIFEYTHPTDPPAPDEKFRTVTLGIKDLVLGQYEVACKIYINIYRPPVVLVHGLWSDSAAFQQMRNSLIGSLYDEEMVIIADYHATNAATFNENANVVPSELNLLVQQCRAAKFSVGKSILIGHSMGGLLSRQYLQTTYNNDVYRLITCNTPHAGSQFANFLLDPYWAVANDAVCGVLYAGVGTCYGGAINDLRVGSNEIMALNSGFHPSDVGVHAVTTTMEPPTLFDLVDNTLTWSEWAQTLIALQLTCNGTFFYDLFEGDVHDLVVAELSQRGGMSGSQFTTVLDQMHVGSTDNPGVIYVVRDLLSEPYSSSKFTTNGYSPPTVNYNNNLFCTPLLTESPNAPIRSSSSLTFDAPAPGDSLWTSGDTLSFSVSGIGVDTIVAGFHVSSNFLYVDKKIGPNTSFNIAIPEDVSGDIPLVVLGYTGTEGIVEYIVDTVHIAPAYSLIDISVYPTKIFSDVGDTTTFQVIGHYDDGVDRTLNATPGVSYQFTTYSASRTSAGNIRLDYPENDTLTVHVGSLTSQAVKIYFSADPTGPVFWLGGNGDWTDDAQWNIGCAPGAQNTVYIQSGSCTIPALIQAEAKAIVLTEAELINNGSLSIINSDYIGLNIDKATVQNNGSLHIEGTVDAGILMSGTSSDSAYLTNNGSISVMTCDGVYGVYFVSRYFFLNDTAGSLDIENCGTVNSFNVLSGNTVNFENRGCISLDGGPMTGSGKILNSGSFTIDYSTPAMHKGLTCGYFKNTPTGHLYIANVHQRGIDMHYSTDSLINEGLIEISNSSDLGLWTNYASNSGHIAIHDITNEAIFLEGNNYYFRNLESGTIDIDSAGIGIYIRNTGAQFVNQGDIHIDSTDAEGILVKFNAIFNNDTTGQIQIGQTGGYGIYVLDNINTIFNNAGLVDINGTAQHGVRVHSNAAFHNTETGAFHIADCGESGLATTGSSFQSNAIITNAGTIQIEEPIAQYGIDHGKKLTNSPCGIIKTMQPLHIAAGNFVNDGFLHLDNTDPHMFVGSNKIVNNGWLEDREGLLDIALRVTNNGVVAAPVSYSGCSGSDITGAFLLGSLSGYDVSDPFVDTGLSISGGSFDTMSNTIVPNADGVLSTDWYFITTDLINGCLDTMAMTAKPVCPVICGGDPFYWTGCADTSWTNVDNWNLGVLPQSLDTVTITGRPAGDVFPEISNTSFVKMLEMRPGACLTVKSGGTLQLQE